MNEFKIFREISVGGLAKEPLIHQLVNAGIQFNEYAKILFEHSSFSSLPEISKVKLIKVKLADLHLDVPCSLQTVVNQASILGVKPCPLYLGAFLRLDYLNQPEGPYLTIVSPQPEQDEEYPTGFYIRNFNNSLWLRGYRATGDCEWPPDNEFIFRE